MKKVWMILALLGVLSWSPAYAATNAVSAYFETATLQNAAVATGNGTAMPVDRFSSIGVQVTIAATATVAFEGSQDGTTWASKVCVSASNTSGTLVTSATSTGTYQCSVAGLALFRARISAWTSGAVTVTALATTAGFSGGGSGTGVSVAEDAAHSSGESVSPIACRRKDTAATSAGTDGDWATVDCDANGAMRVRIDSSAVGNAADFTAVEDAAETAGGGLAMMGSVRRDTAATSAGTAGDNATVNTDGLGRLWTREGNPCADYARITSAAISESTAATNEQVALTASNLIYVCSYKWVTTAANSLSWSYGTGTDCNTGTTAIEGAQPFAANGGVVESGGGYPLFVVPAGNALCLVSSAATAHGGRVSYVKTAAP